ncbi:TIGR00341 family protein [Lishizhenia tianjinensis]|uniref:TIGR00341 family protein n=1 Tax=Lishizhenia tianjinensis TaxID=477690 RepID=A0A1I6XV37_9FLAO|nr:DUF389 domain-containing protein [Lishizhenia tianjinensis]SFT42375.1 TIGR00341 family protein [Lishizhenia tianjinensis]
MNEEKLDPKDEQNKAQNDASESTNDATNETSSSDQPADDLHAEKQRRKKAFEHLYNNDNMYDDPIEGDPTKIKINTDVKEGVKSIFNFLKDTVSFQDGADINGTIKNIREGINFVGPNVWVLMCSIVVASVGLNTNSVAVIIGAMLISPLMGPIRGMGLGVGTNDIKLIVDSLKNFGVAVGISLLTAYIYFLITPLHGLTPELEARTGPNLMDVFIAFFGGLAGIIAASRGDNNTVIPGVAIATALMPPLCTAGYGLANGNWQFFFGASYLFLINTLFICLSTILVVRYLKFPIRHFINPKVEKKVKVVSTVLIFLVIVPSVYLFYGKVQETIFTENATNYIRNVIETDETLDVNQKFDLTGEVPKVEVILTNKTVPQSTLDVWNAQLKTYNLSTDNISIIQGEDVDEKLKEYLDEFKNKNLSSGAGYDVIKQKDELIRDLNIQNATLKNSIDQLKNQKVNARTLASTIALHYPEVESIEVLSGVHAQNDQVNDTIFALAVHYFDSLEVDKLKVNEKLRRQLEIQLKDQNLLGNFKVKVYNQ